MAVLPVHTNGIIIRDRARVGFAASHNCEPSPTDGAAPNRHVHGLPSFSLARSLGAATGDLTLVNCGSVFVGSDGANCTASHSVDVPSGKGRQSDNPPVLG